LFDARHRKPTVNEKLLPLRLRSRDGKTFAGFGQEISRLPVAEIGHATCITSLELGDREDSILRLEFDMASIG
jgi:hypothetical protein